MGDGQPDKVIKNEKSIDDFFDNFFTRRKSLIEVNDRQHHRKDDQNADGYVVGFRVCKFLDFISVHRFKPSGSTPPIILYSISACTFSSFLFSHYRKVRSAKESVLAAGVRFAWKSVDLDLEKQESKNKEMRTQYPGIVPTPESQLGLGQESEFCMVLKYKRINCFPSFM